MSTYKDLYIEMALTVDTHLHNVTVQHKSLIIHLGKEKRILTSIVISAAHSYSSLTTVLWNKKIYVIVSTGFLEQESCQVH